MRALADGSVGHVEVFQMAGVGTAIFGRPRRLSRDRRARPTYTLNCEEPNKETRRKITVAASVAALASTSACGTETAASSASEPPPSLNAMAYTDFDDVVTVDAGLFVATYEDWQEADVAESFVGQTNGLLGVAVPGKIVIVTGGQYGPVNIRIEWFDEEPPPVESSEDVVEASFTTTDGWLWFAPLYTGDFYGTQLDPNTHYRIRYSAQGLDAANDEDINVSDVPLDSYVIQMWAAPTAPDLILNQTSEVAEYWRTAWTT
jgi:hypothetical protein